MSAISQLAAALVLAGAVATQHSAWAQQTPTTRADAERRYMAPESFSALAKDKSPAVVNISTTQKMREQRRGGSRQERGGRSFEGTPFEDMFRDFFGDGMPGSRPPRDLTALGSGFIIDPQGYVVTNNHVVEGADEIKVVLQDDTELAATLVGRDPRTDLALLRVASSRPLPAVEWGDSDDAEVGDWVLAIGNPFGLGGTVTSGIISARARDIHSGPYDDFLQTDAAINRGNSGGPLFDMEGQVIGVNTAIFSPTGGSVGIGFAVPSNLAQSVVSQLREGGSVRRGWLGVSLQPLTDDLAAGLGLEQSQGALVAEVTEGSPAAKAGLQSGDVILGFRSREVEDARELSRAVADAPIGEPAKLTVWRDGERRTLTAEITRLEETVAAAADGDAAQGEGRLGLTLAPLTPELRKRFDVAQSTQGVLVVDIAEDSLAAESRLSAGDVIVRVGSKSVNTPSEVAAAVEQARTAERDAVVLLRERDGARMFVALPLDREQG